MSIWDLRLLVYLSIPGLYCVILIALLAWQFQAGPINRYALVQLVLALYITITINLAFFSVAAYDWLPWSMFEIIGTLAIPMAFLAMPLTLAVYLIPLSVRNEERQHPDKYPRLIGRHTIRLNLITTAAAPFFLIAEVVACSVIYG